MRILRIIIKCLINYLQFTDVLTNIVRQRALDNDEVILDLVFQLQPVIAEKREFAVIYNITYFIVSLIRWCDLSRDRRSNFGQLVQRTIKSWNVKEKQVLPDR